MWIVLVSDMNFSAVHFNSALQRFGALLPIGQLIQLGTVQPVLKAQIPAVRLYDRVTISPKKNGNEIVMIVETNQDVKVYELFYTQNAILNDGPIECKYLALKDVQSIPSEAITCTNYFMTNVIGSDLLGLVRNEIKTLFIQCYTPVQSTVTLSEVVTGIGPELEHFEFPATVFPDGADWTSLVLRRRQKILLNCSIYISDIGACVKWLEKNTEFLATGSFCKDFCIEIMDESCPSKDQIDTIKRIIVPYFSCLPGSHATDAGRITICAGSWRMLRCRLEFTESHHWCCVPNPSIDYDELCIPPRACPLVPPQNPPDQEQ